MAESPDHYKLEDGSERWEVDHKLHRDDGPALLFPDGTQTWYRHGVIHRDDDLPAHECKNGDKAWYKDGLLHREGKPAIEYADGRTEWWLQGRKLSDAETVEYRQALIREQWRQEADRVVEEMARGLQNPITVLKLPKISK